MFNCVIVGVVFATSTSTTIYYVPTDISAIQQRDLRAEVARLAFRDRDEVLVVPELPGLPPRSQPVRCGFETLYATLVGGHS